MGWRIKGKARDPALWRWVALREPEMVCAYETKKDLTVALHHVYTRLQMAIDLYRMSDWLPSLRPQYDKFELSWEEDMNSIDYKLGQRVTVGYLGNREGRVVGHGSICEDERTSKHVVLVAFDKEIAQVPTRCGYNSIGVLPIHPSNLVPAPCPMCGK